METTTRTRETNSLLGLVAGLREDLGDLFRQEVQLAKTELSEKAAKFGRNAAYLGVGAVVGYLGLVFLLLSFSFLIAFGFEALGLSTGMALFLGFLVIAIISGAVGGILAMKAIHAFSSESLAPQKTIETLKEIKQGGIEQVPIRMQTPSAPEPEDNRTSDQIRSEVERTRTRIGREVRGIKTRLNVARVANHMVGHVTSHPMRSVGIGVGTGLAGFIVMRVARLFGRKRTA